MAEAHRTAGRTAEAGQICREALRGDPNSADALHLLGLITLQAGDPQAAVPLVERALKARHGVAQFHRTIGVALRHLGEFDAAISHFRRALRSKPDDYHCHSELGFALHAIGSVAESGASFKRALALNPGAPDAHFHLSIPLLNSGDFERGWAEYEFRPERIAFEQSGVFAQCPEWRGQDLAGKALVVRGEQGFGDTIQFARYVPLLAARGATVVLFARPELLPVLAALPGVSQLGSHGNLPAADYCCLLGSLPGCFGTTPENIPATIPYLAPPAASVERWRGRFDGVNGLRVGLVWAGSPTHSNDRNRSMALAELAGLGKIPGVTFFSLQKGPAAAQTASSGLILVPLADQLQDFGDTAAVLMQLDLLVCVDTSVAHLAGALGRPVWLLLPTGLDWRWLSRRDDSPWYPTMRIFRQEEPGDWAGVAERVGRALTERVATVPGASGCGHSRGL